MEHRLGRYALSIHDNRLQQHPLVQTLFAVIGHHLTGHHTLSLIIQRKEVDTILPDCTLTSMSVLSCESASELIPIVLLLNKRKHR